MQKNLPAVAKFLFMHMSHRYWLAHNLQLHTGAAKLRHRNGCRGRQQREWTTLRISQLGNKHNVQETRLAAPCSISAHNIVLHIQAAWGISVLRTGLHITMRFTILTLQQNWCLPAYHCTNHTCCKCKHTSVFFPVDAFPNSARYKPYIWILKNMFFQSKATHVTRAKRRNRQPPHAVLWNI